VRNAEFEVNVEGCERQRLRGLVWMRRELEQDIGLNLYTRVRHLDAVSGRIIPLP
jgi:hypothetical protein